MKRIKDGLATNKKKICFLLSVFLILSGNSLAQEHPAVNAHQIDSSIHIDGRFDEEAWSQAEAITGFRQFSPDEGSPSTQQTEVRVLYGDGGPVVPPIIGQAQIEEGINTDVQISFGDSTVTDGEKLWPMVHYETGTVGEYEFDGAGTPDQPVIVNGNVLTTQITVSN